MEPQNAAELGRNDKQGCKFSDKSSAFYYASPGTPYVICKIPSISDCPAEAIGRLEERVHKLKSRCW